MEASSRIIADSVTEDGHRLVTFEAKCWRPVLAEQNTHCVLARNSASSRAIPIKKMLERYEVEHIHNPIVWPSEQKGMQGGTELTGAARVDAKNLWYDISDNIADRVTEYVEAHPDPTERLHKSILNRLLENGLWQTQIITATQWDGYFWQRAHEDAEPHIRAMAASMQEAMEKSKPVMIHEGGWHLPYWAENGGHLNDWDEAADFGDPLEVAKQCSAARCARVSYLTQSGVRDLFEDVTLYERLTSNRVGSKNPPHASPLEHVATPWPENVQNVTMPNGVTMGPLPKLGKLIGWLQLRHLELGF